MADPQEGVAADGTIVTGADRSRVPAPFEPLRADAVALAGGCGASLYSRTLLEEREDAEGLATLAEYRRTHGGPEPPSEIIESGELCHDA